ncbi:MAG: RdgB/HAM1 family non-canonical purine NTP pyrophosphatase [Chthoniobacterales bacterium]
MDLLLATSNSHKSREFAALLGPQFTVRDLSSLPALPRIVESGSTFAENAAIKALAVSRLSREELVIADDSGLEVDALSGAPGIVSARYAGEQASDSANVEKLLRELRRVNARDASARFVCALAAARGGNIIFSTQTMVAGTIRSAPCGAHGFGYDPIFVPAGLSETFAELPAEVKNRISHRARAARELNAFLKAARH